MSDTPAGQGAQNQVPKADIRHPRRLSIVWFIPLAVAVIAGWIAYKSISEKGPSITITFNNADGLEAGKTKIMFKGVQAGTVESIDIGEDLTQVVVHATMVKETEGHLNEKTKFWVVRPEVSLTRISGLSTLVSGAFIAIKPGDGKPERAFKGLDRTPLSDEQGSRFTLKAEDLGSLRISAPVTYHGVVVGEILSHELSKDDDGVLIHVVIRKPHEQLVRRNSLFWNASGIDVRLRHIFDASARIGSLENLVAGGIAFASPLEPADPAPAETVFKLYDERPESLHSRAVEEGLKFVLTAKDLGGVQAGDEITYREIVVGQVFGTRLAKTAGGVEMDVSIDKEHAALVRENSQFWNDSGLRLSFGDLMDPSVEVSSLESLVAGGIAFLTPAAPGLPVKPGHRFAMLDERPDALSENAAEAAKEFKVTLTAEDLSGVGEGDPVLYRDIEIGKVRKTQLNAAANGVEIEIGIARAHAGLIRANSVFWNASGAKLNLGDLVDASVEIESLKSFLAGGIALANPSVPGPLAAPGATYKLHAERPEALFRRNKETDALHIVLKSEVQGSVNAGDPILYREVEVGKVTDVELSDDASFVALHVAIEARYAPLVRSKSVFWNASGIHASFGLFAGADIDIESLNALLRGGIAFATPKDGGEAAANGAAFPLYREAKKEWQSWAPHIRLPKPEPNAAAAAQGAEPGTPKSEAPAGQDPESEPTPTAEQEATTSSSSEAAPLPTSVALSGTHVSTSALSEALAKLGFTNVGSVQHAGSIVRVNADWEGEPGKLRIDTRTGRIKPIE